MDNKENLRLILSKVRLGEPIYGLNTPRDLEIYITGYLVVSAGQNIYQDCLSYGPGYECDEPNNEVLPLTLDYWRKLVIKTIEKELQ